MVVDSYKVNFNHKAPNCQVQHSMSIIFSNDVVERIIYPHDDALMVTLDIAFHNVARIMVNTRSLMDIIFVDALRRMDIKSMKMHL